jgi:hypothetical protein
MIAANTNKRMYDEYDGEKADNVDALILRVGFLVTFRPETLFKFILAF